MEVAGGQRGELYNTLKVLRYPIARLCYAHPDIVVVDQQPTLFLRERGGKGKRVRDPGLPAATSTRARALFAKAIKEDPSNASARAGIIAAYSPEFFETLDLEVDGDFDWSPTERLALEATLLRAAGKWDELAALDEALSTVGWDELICGDVQLLRAQWRIETGEAARGVPRGQLLVPRAGDV